MAKLPTEATVRNVRAALRKAMPDAEAHTYLNHRIRVSSNSRRTGVAFSSGGWEVAKRWSYPSDLVSVRFLTATASFDSDYTRRHREAGTVKMIEALTNAGFSVYSTWTPRRDSSLRISELIVTVA